MFVGFKTFAQEEKRTLYPIAVKRQLFGVKFIYDRQIIDNASALQIPLLQARDPKVNLEFLTYKQQQKLVKLINIVPAGLSLIRFSIEIKYQVAFIGQPWGVLY